MDKFINLILTFIFVFIPLIGNCQKPIKRDKKTITKKHYGSKKNNNHKSNKTRVNNSSASLKNSDSQSKKDALIQNILSNMIDVDGASFLMGSDDEDALRWEKPVHLEKVNSFRIGKFEVSQKEWNSVMDTNPSYFEGDELPVQGVSLDDCMEFIRRLNDLSGLEFRLPTETEWEFAARGGKMSNGFVYSGSNNLDEVAWYNDNCENKIHAIGKKSPNEIGIYDMSGNVWEWTSDKHSKNYNSPRNEEDNVIRGGSWLQDKKDCRVSNRYFSILRNNGLSYGFRLVLDCKQPCDSIINE